MTNLEVRSWTDFEIREESADEWTITGRAVPWLTPISVGGYSEQFERGALVEQAGGAHLYASHDHISGGLPIGKIDEIRDEDDGLHIRAKISMTDKGREVYTLLRDGVLKSLSVGFTPIEDEVRDGVVTRTQALLREVSVVAIPAYAGAAVTAVRSEESHESTPAPVEEASAEADAPVAEAPAEVDVPEVPPAAAPDPAETAPVVDDAETTPAGISVTEPDPAGTPEEESQVDNEITEVRSAIEDLSRRFDAMKAETASAASEGRLEFRSLGHFIKSLTEKGRDHKADADLVTRAYAGSLGTGGANTGDSNPQPAWVQKDIKLVQENRPILELFDSAPLPSTGNSIEFPVFSSKTGDVATQTNEGDDLAYLELVVSEGTAPVRTYGGYSQLSKQAIQRSDVPYLDKVLQMQKISYAKVTNGVIRTALTGLASTNTGSLLFADKGKAAAWVDVALMGLADIDANSTGLTGDVWIMNLTQFRQLTNVLDTAGVPVFVKNPGEADVRGLRGNVAGLPVYVDTKIASNHGFSYIVSREALTVRESGPFNLNDENVINLTEAFSLYGYLAVETNDVKGVTKVTHPTS